MLSVDDFARRVNEEMMFNQMEWNEMKNDKKHVKKQSWINWTGMLATKVG